MEGDSYISPIIERNASSLFGIGQISSLDVRPVDSNIFEIDSNILDTVKFGTCPKCRFVSPLDCFSGSYWDSKFKSLEHKHTEDGKLTNSNEMNMNQTQKGKNKRNIRVNQANRGKRTMKSLNVYWSSFDEKEKPRKSRFLTTQKHHSFKGGQAMRKKHNLLQKNHGQTIRKDHKLQQKRYVKAMKSLQPFQSGERSTKQRNFTSSEFSGSDDDSSFYPTTFIESPQISGVMSIDECLKALKTIEPPLQEYHSNTLLYNGAKEQVCAHCHLAIDGFRLNSKFFLKDGSEVHKQCYKINLDNFYLTEMFKPHTKRLDHSKDWERRNDYKKKCYTSKFRTSTTHWNS